MGSAQVGPFNAFKTGDSNGVAVSGTNTYYGSPFRLGSLWDASYDLYWGTNVGTFTVWVSNKPEPSLANDNDWKQLTLAVAIVQPNGSNTGDFLDLTDLPAVWVRLKYVNSSGTGTIHAWCAAKAD